MEILDDLRASRERTLAYFELPEESLNKSYAPGKWTVRELLNHITDAETVLYDRIRRVISKPNQVIWGFDQDRWAKGLEYPSFPLSINKSIYEATRAGVLYLAETFYESHGANGFVHSETGSRTLKDEFDKVAWHNDHHLEQIELALRG